MQWIRNIINGFAFGLANVIPGVSGGTLALMLGFYERLLNLLHQVKPSRLKSMFTALKTEGKSGLIRELKDADLSFGVQLGIGAVGAVVVMGPVMTYLLREQFSATYGFFFGLILISILVPLKLVKKWNAGALIGLLIGLGITVAVSYAVNPADKTITKSVFLQAQILSEQSGNAVTKIENAYASSEYISVAIAGFIGISAMLLPGVSGSLLLILMGKYQSVLAAIAGARKLIVNDLIYLGVFCFGMFLGMVIMSRLISYALKKFGNVTLGFLTGLVIGSLYSLWPFKEFIIADIYKKESGVVTLYKDHAVATNINVLPSLDATFWMTLITFALGVGLMVWFLRNEPSAE